MLRILGQALLGLMLLATPARATSLHDAFEAAWARSPASRAIAAERDRLLAPELASLQIQPGFRLPPTTPLPSAARLEQVAVADAARATARLELAGEVRAMAATAALAETERSAAARRLAADRALMLAAGTAPPLAEEMRRAEARLRTAMAEAVRARAELQALTGQDGLPDLGGEPPARAVPPDPLAADAAASPAAARAATLSRMRARLELETAETAAPALRSAATLAATRAARAQQGWHDGAIGLSALLEARAAAADATLAEARAAIGLQVARGRLNQADGILP
jgi:hypothetical protein